MKLLDGMITFTSGQKQRPVAFQPLTQFPLIIVVGLTGVGKSTVITLLQTDLHFTLLPNRREVTDKIMISPLQMKDGRQPHLITDRIKRFEYTTRYRTKYPGGMAYALTQIAINSAWTNPLLFFDGLRGLNEVEYAATYFPQARFVVLDAPDIVRLKRLLNRADTFDTTEIQPWPVNQNLPAGLMAIPHIKGVFSEPQLRQIAQLVTDMSIDDVIKKVSIIIKERHNYDSTAAWTYLTKTLPPKQVLVVDTASQSPESTVARIRVWLGNGQ